MNRKYLQYYKLGKDAEIEIVRRLREISYTVEDVPKDSPFDILAYHDNSRFIIDCKMRCSYHGGLRVTVNNYQRWIDYDADARKIVMFLYTYKYSEFKILWIPVEKVSEGYLAPFDPSPEDAYHIRREDCFIFPKGFAMQ